MNWKFSILLAGIILLIGCGKNKKQTITWVSSNPDSVWVIQEIKLKDELAMQHDSVISIYPNNEEQVIDGFGACFNELGWEALMALPKEDRDDIISSIFHVESGCKFNLCRMPIGANDFAVDWYSLNETRDDFDMENFSIERDRDRLIPYINEALNYNPSLKIWASPWCPPAWMKINNHYACKPADVNDLRESGRGKMKDGLPIETQFIMEPKYLDAYATYFSKFIEAYKNEGINIYAVHVQNEPNSCQNFPSCLWKPSDLTTFIGEYLGPHFSDMKLDTEIWLGTIERPQFDRVDGTLQDADAGQYIKGVGFQWAGKGAIPEVNKNYPNLKLMQTESECGNGTNSWAWADHTFNLMKHYFNNGANSYMYWNMILDETGRSHWGWKQNSMITINTNNGEVTYNPEFYLIKHFSHFIPAGSIKVKSSDSNCLAFKNEDTIVIVYYNAGESQKKQFSINNKFIDIELAESSFNTFVVEI